MQKVTRQKNELVLGERQSQGGEGVTILEHVDNLLTGDREAETGFQVSPKQAVHVLATFSLPSWMFTKNSVCNPPPPGSLP